jgi:outer membrane protein assembly factor BamA
VIGLATVFKNGDRFDPIQFPGLNGILPISERFFAGGSNTLRGFDFESAGPRVVIVPTGTFRNSNGDPVFLDPFTVPFGGNGMAIVNLEARIPITKSIRAVPFYDGGNVFRRVSDIINPPDVPPNDVFQANLRALWTNTVGLGLRIKTPIGGEFGVDYGYLLNPPRFLIPQGPNPIAIYQLKREHIHFRFSQAF